MSVDDLRASDAARLREELLRRRLAGGRGGRRSQIVTADRNGPLPLSFGQQQMWFLNRLDVGSAEYLVPVAVRLRGPLDVPALTAAWQQVLSRHEILRTRYELAGSDPVQVIDAPRPVPLDVEDVRGRNLPDVEALARREAATPFDLAREWPVRARLFALADDDHVLIATFHHIACDAWSVGLFAAELSAGYQRRELPPLTVQYADFAAWERQTLDIDGHLDYWRSRLAGVPTLELPTDRPRPAIRDYAGATVPFTIPAGLVDAAADLAKAHDTTLFTVLLTAFQALLARHTTGTDIPVGVTVSGRNRPELQQVIGYGVNSLVVRAEWTGDVTFAELLAHTRTRLLEAFEHQAVPFARLVDELQPRRDLSRTPLYQVDFVLHENRAEAFDLPGVTVEQLTGDETAKFDLTFEAIPAGDGSLDARLRFAATLFDAGTVARMAAHLVTLLDQVVAAPTRRLSTVDIVGDDRADLLRRWNTAAPAEAVTERAHETFQRHVAATPDAIALVCGEDRLTYAELNARANRIAHRLIALGAGPEDLVGVCLDRSIDLVPTLLGVLKAGAAYVPLEPGNPDDRLAHMLAETRSRIVVTAAPHADRVACLHTGELVLADAVTDGPDTDPVTAGGPDTLAYVIYTSGSTGRPKGVCLTHANIARLFSAADQRFHFSPDDVWAQAHSYAFDVSVWEMWGALLFGGRLVMVTAAAARSPEDLLDLLVEQRVTIMEQTPTAFRGLARLAADGDPRLDRLALRVITLGGEPIEASELRRWADRVGLDAPELVNTYGITETTVTTTHHRIAEADLESSRSPIGLPFETVPMHLLDEFGELAPIGVPGEIHVGGDCVARGYLGRPALTAERFVPDPFGAPGSRLYRSGDLGRRRPDGTIDFLGRGDSQVKIRGYRIEPDEIQARLAEFPGVRESVVTVHATGDERQLVAYVVGDFAMAELRAHAAAALPEYMVPSAFIALDRIPLTISGKIDRRALPAPDRSAFALAEHVAPRTPAEQRMAAVWSEVLGVDEIGVEDSFFDLGGDSIRAVRLAASLRDNGFEVAIRDVFEHQTLAALARHSGPATERFQPVEPFALIGAADRARLPEGVVDAYPLSQIQTGMLVETLNADGRHAYHDVNSFRITELAFDEAALRGAVAAVVRRHEVLRTSVDLTSYSQPLQLVHAHADVSITVLDGLPDREFAARERADLFDLATAPLFRLTVHVEADAWRLTFTQSHAITDGWSMNSLLMELLSAYRGGTSHTATDVRYADFIAAELAATNNPDDRAYWQEVVQRYQPLVLPAGWGGAGREAFRVPVPVDDLTDGLRVLASRAKASLKTVLLAAHLKTLSMLTTEESVHTGLVCHGRLEAAGGEQVQGMHLNTLPFPLDRTARTWDDLVRQVFVRETEIWGHRHYPMPEIQRAAGGERLIGVMFDYQDFHQVDTSTVDIAGSMGDGASDFALTVIASAGQVVLTTTGDVLSRVNAERLAAMYRQVLVAMATDPDGDASAGYLPLDEEARLLGDWNTTRELPVALTVHEMFQDQAAETPDAVAVVFGDVQLTYAELNARANQIAHHLIALGAGPETLVGVRLERGVDLAPALLGVLKSGAAYLPLDPANPAERLDQIVDDAGTRIVVTEKFLSVVDGPTHNPVTTVAPDNLIYVIYTSGSTGTPKGVSLTHANVARLLTTTWDRYRFGPDDVWTLFHSYAFDVSVWEMWGALLHGGRLVVVPRETTRSPADFVDLLARNRSTVLCQTPSAFRSLLDEPGIAELDSLRAIVFAGERLDTADLAPWVDRHGLRTELINMYGITETTVHSTYHRLDQHDLADPALSDVGLPLPDSTIHLLDAAGALAPVGVPGEIHVGGPGLARGYLNRPALTAERFVPNPYGPAGSRQYRSGDLAVRRDTGTLNVLGRIDTQVKIRGYRIELGEIQAALRVHDRVDDAVVIAVDGTLVAYLVADAPPTAAELREWLAATLPSYMVPTAFVPIAAIPLTPNGKLDRRALPEPGRDAYAATQRQAPRNPVEEQLAAIWTDILGVGDVGVHDSFFDLGGDSIRAVRLVGALRQAGHGVTIQDVYQQRTIAALAATATDAEAFEPVAPFALISAEDRALLPADAADAYPASQVQTGMLVEMLSSEAGNTYHNLNSFRVPDDAPFEPAAFRAAVDLATRRHDMLRTSFDLDGYSLPMQIVHAEAEIPVSLHDLRGLSDADKQAAAYEFAARERHDTFDITDAPLVRIAVHLESDHAWRLTFTHSHAVTEGWSYHTLLMELIDSYTRLRDGRDVSLEPLPVRYADFVAAELESLHSNEDQQFWQHVVNSHAPLVLPTAWGCAGAHDAFRVRVPFLDLESGLRTLATQARASVKSVLLAAHLKVMGALTTEPSFHSGLVCHGRLEAPGGDRVLGMHLNSLPIGVERPDGSWADFVAEVFAREAEIWAHRRHPLPAVQRASGSDRLLTVLFSYLDFHQVDTSTVDLAAGPGVDATRTEGATFNEFSLNVIADDGHLALNTFTDVMTAEQADRLAAMYRTVLTAMAADPDGDATESPLPRAERDRILASWNETGADWPVVPVIDVIEAQNPAATALVSGSSRVTFGELDARANRIAHALGAAGAGPDVVVGVCLPRGVDLVSALLGVWKAGAAYLPLDPSNPSDRIAHALSDSGAATLVDEEFLKQVNDFPSTRPVRHTDAEHLAYVIYTSGSTGRPKGVMITHAGLANHLRWAAEELVSGPGGAPLFSSVAFDLPATNLFAPLMTGRPVHLLPHDLELTDLGAELLAGAPHSFVKLTPGHLDMLTHQLSDEQAAGLAGTVLVAGEALPAALANHWRGLTTLVNEYGPTEAAIGSTIFPVDSVQDGVVPLGGPLPNVTAHVLDPVGHPAALEVAGELHIGGLGLARGYLGQPALTAEKFVPNPYGEPGSRLYRTGDLTRRRPDGTIDFLGRIDTQVKIRGYRIELNEIRSRLLAHPAITDAVVTAVDGRLLAYHVGAASDLPAFLAVALPDYMVPAVFTEIDRVPLTANGKIDFRALPAPGTAAVVAGKTPAQQRVAQICAEVLGIDVDAIGPAHSFFELGGDSIRAVRLAGAFRDGGLDISIRDIFQLRTVELLGELIGEQMEPVAAFEAVVPFALIGAEDRAKLPADVVDAYPLSQVQTGMVVEMLVTTSGSTAAYHNVGSYRMPDDQPFDAKRFRAAVDSVTARHDGLRTSMHLAGYSQPLQLVHAQATIPVAVHDLRGLDLAAQRAAALAFLRHEQATPFTLDRAPLIRLAVHLENGAWRLTFTQSHAITDGWSLNTLLMELLDAYNGIEHTTPAIRYADYIAAELSSLDDVEDGRYWQDLTQLYEPFALPAGWGSDAPRRPHHVEIRLDAPALRALATSTGTSVKTVLLAAHLKTLSLLTADPAFHTGLVVHGRIEAADGERVLGMHLNTLPLPYDRTATTWHQLIEQAHAAEAELWGHRRYPLPAIQRASGHERLVSVLFEYLDFHQVDAAVVDRDAEPGVDADALLDAAVNEFALNVIAGPGSIELWTFTDVLSGENAARIAEVYRAVVEAMTADLAGDATAACFPWEESALGTTLVCEPASSVLGLIEAQAARTPDAVAVITGSHELTYRELDERANQIARHLAGVGAGPESLVAVRLSRGPDLLPALLGVWKAGAAYLPVDTTMPAERVAHMLADAAVCAELTDDVVAGITGSTEPITRVDELANLAYVLYTSGSTGRPKGVMISQHALANLIGSMRELTGDGGVWLASTSVSFDISTLELYLPLISGGRLVLAGDESLVGLVARHGVTHVQATPSGWRLLLANGFDRPDVIGLVGGEELPAPLARELRPRLAALTNVYGPTETTIWSAQWPVPADTKSVSIGGPVANTALHVLDGSGQPALRGVAGELHIAGDGLGRGYLGQPALTAEKFVPNPYGETGSRLYRTGDVTRLTGDGLEFLGRADTQLKIRGYRVEAGEIESRLREHPAVRDAVVVARPDAAGDKSLVAYVVGAVDGLREHVLATLPDYMAPAAFVTIDAIPLTISGKLDRKALPELDRAAFGAAPRVAPRTPVEERFAAVWSEVLGLDEVGVTDNFFDLGGDSIRAVRLSSALREAGHDIGIRDIFEHRTIAGLAGLDTGSADAVEPVAPFALIGDADRATLPADVVDAYPLSQIQVGMLVHQLSTGIYHNINSFRLTDRAFDADQLRLAVDAVTARHDILRTSVHLTGYSEPLQLVHAHVEIPISVTDLRGLSESDVRRIGEQFFTQERENPAELATAPLIRLAVHLEDNAWRLTFTQSHAITDGWSLNTLLMELLDAYNGVGRTTPAIRYADYIAAELSSLDNADDSKHWQQVVDEHVPFRLPDAWTGEPQEARVPYHDLEAGLRALANRAGTSMKSVMLAAHLKALSMLTHAPAFHTGLVVHGRIEAADGERVLGMHLNTLPLPYDRTAATWLDLVRLAHRAETDVLAHRRFPLPAVQRLSEEDRLVPVMFDYQDFHQVDTGQVDVTSTLNDVRTEFDLHVNVSRGSISLTGAVDAERLAGLYRAVLETMVAEPAGDATATVLPASEWMPAQTVVELPVTLRLHEQFEAQVRTTPDAVAVVFEDIELTYAEVNARANRLAHRLRDLGAGPDTLVGVCLDRGVELVPALIGILKSGAAYVPLDPANPNDRLAHVLGDTAAPIVVTTTAHAARLATVHTGHLVTLDDLTGPETDPSPVGGVDDLMYVIYTSGSTGRPKGVALSHANVTRLFTASDRHFDFTDDDVWTLFHSYAFDVSVFEMWGALLHGGRLVVVSQDVARSPEDFLGLLADRGVTVLCQTPSAFRPLAGLAADGDPRLDRLALREVIFAGERLDLAELSGWTSRFGVRRPALANMYGPTETVHATFHRVTADAPIGRALADLRIDVLDPSGQPAPTGVPGEIFIGGASVARGYLGRPALTAEKFLPDPFGRPGSRRYRTGDLASLRADGVIDYLGRIDSQVKIRGYRIEPAEIQVQLVAHPQVRDAAVIVRDNQLVAYTVGTADAAALRAHLAVTLPDYMVPSAFVAVDALPLTTNGKLDQRALPAPDRSAFAATEHVAPRTPTEQRMAAAWSEVLGVDEIGVEDSFFDLGGDSMRAVRLAGALREAGFDTSIKDIFELRTIAALAATAGEATTFEPVAPFALIGADDRAALPADVVDAYPLSQVQLGMLVEMMASDGMNAYHNVGSFRMPDDRPFVPAAFERAFAVLVARHEVLRTSFDLDSFPQPLQLVHAHVEVPITVHDVRRLDAEAQRRIGEEFIARERAELFDLAAAPLLRVAVHLESDAAWRLSFTQSHAITDGWTLNTLLMELLATYRRLRDGLEPALPPLSVRYADFIAAELSSTSNTDDRAYWEDVVQRHEPLVLPAGWGGGVRERHHVQVAFPELVDDLRRLATAAKASTKSVLLAAHLAVMGTLTTADTFHTGLVCHGRLEVPGGIGVAGMHLNTLPVPFTRGARTWRELVRQAHAAETAAWGHRRFPLPAIQRASGSTERLVTVMFDFQDFHQVDTEMVDTGAAFGAGATEFLLNVTANPDGLGIGTFTDVVSRANARRLGEMYRQVLTAMAADPGGDATVGLLPATDQDVLARTSDGGRVDWAATDVVALFEAQVDAVPTAIALVSDSATLTYRELDDRANQIAHSLRGIGVGPDVVVGVCLDREPELVAALLGVLKSGGAYLPIDPGTPADRVEFMVADTAAATVLTAERLAGTVGAPTHRLATAIDAQQLAYVIYTSGSTGRPKGVMVHHQGLANYLQWTVDAYTAAGPGGAPLFSSIAFDLPATNVYVPLVTGRPVHLIPSDVDSSELGRALLAGAPYGFVKLTPAHLDLLAHQLSAAEIAALAPVVVVGGEALPTATAAQWLELLGPGALINEFGPTEASIANITHAIVDRHDAIVPIGLPLPNTSAHVLDPVGHPSPLGVHGELFIGGVGVARGYLGRPALTAERFVPDPFGPAGSRLYRTGDLARRFDDGTLEFLGRLDTQVKIRGYRVEPGEIQARLAELAGVRKAFVAVRDNALVAYVVGESPDPARLRAHLAAVLPEYMVPAAFLTLDRLPLTPNGKVDQRALPAPDRGAFATAGLLAPRTPMEHRVAAVWRAVLGVDVVGVEDGFFDLGGDSIRAIQLVGALRQAGLDVGIRDVFELRTIAGLAALSTDGPAAPFRPVAPFALIGDDDRALLPADVVDAYPLSQIQTGMLVETLAAGDRHSYHNVGSFRIPDDTAFDPDRLRAAVATVVARHDVLRTSMHLDGFSEPLQLVHATAEVPITVHDLRSLTVEDQHRAAGAFLATENDRPFDLSTGPLLRLAVHLESDAAWRLTFTHSHAITDGWTLNTLLMELLRAYRGATGHDASAVRYADFVAAELESLDDKHDQMFWQRVVDEYAPLALPAAWADPAGSPADTFTVKVRLDDLEPALRALAGSARTSVKSVLLAAHLKVLSTITPEPGFHSGLVVHGRLEATGGDRVLGMHLNTVPLPFDRDAATWAGLVRSAFSRETEVWAHRRHPLPAIQRASDSSRLISVLFDYLDFHVVDTGMVDLAGGLGSGANDFALNVLASAGQISLVTSSDVLSRENADRLAGLYRRALELMAADPNGDATTALTSSITDNGPTVERVGTLVDLFEAQALKTPDAIAVITGSERLTFDQINSRANQIAHQLGHRPEQVIAVELDRGPELIPVLLGILKSGAAYLALDPSLPTDRIQHMLDDTHATITINEDYLTEVRGSSDNPSFAIDPDGLAYVIYTSGSTGKPKGVMAHHRGLANYLQWTVEAYASGGNGGAPVFSPLSFDLGIPNIFTPLITGQPVTLMPNNLDTADLGIALAEAGPFSFIKLTPAHLDLLTHQLNSEQARNLAGLIIAAGDAYPKALAERWQNLAGTPIATEYGPTEITIGNSGQPIDELPDTDLIPLGQAIPNTTMHVLTDTLDPTPVGVPGEVYIGGAGLTRGYLNQPALTAERFLPNPYGPAGSRLYKTGDLARWLHNGSLDSLGRIDNQVKIRGYRIELGEIQAAVLGHDGIQDAVIVAENNQLVAYVTGHNAEGLKKHLAATLPDYMVPSAIITLDTIPLTTNGKVDRKALPAPSGHGDDFTAPRTDAERRIAEVWQETLGRNEISVDANFFDLGGDSIHAARMLATARQKRIPLAMWMIYQAPTLAELAAMVAGADRAPLTPGQLAGHAVPRTLRLPLGGPVDVDRLEAAFQQVVAHHDALRQRVHADHVTVEAEDTRRVVHVLDLSGTRADARAEAIETTLAAQREGLDAEHGPLIQATLVEFGGDELLHAKVLPELHVSAHDLAFDEHSWTILVGSLNAAYQGEPLPAATSLRAAAQRLAERAAAPELIDDAHHWLTPRPHTTLPGDAGEAVTVTTTVAADDVYETVLLTSIGRALAQWTGKDRVTLTVAARLDADTLGPLTSEHPQTLWLPKNRDAAAHLRTTTQQLATAPDAIGYALLAHHRPDQDIADELAAQPTPTIRFTHTASAATTGVIGRPEITTPESAHELDIRTHLYDGRLYLRWTARRDRETVQRIVDGHAADLAELLSTTTAAAPKAWSLADIVTTTLREHDIPGASLALIRDGEVVSVEAFGRLAADRDDAVTPDTLFAAGSLSKTVTTAAVLRANLDLDRDVNGYLTSWQVPADGVTLRHLLTHTAGFAVQEHVKGRNGSVLDVLHGRGPASTPATLDMVPGQAFRMNSVHFSVIQQILEDVTGQPFDTAARELLFDPIGMPASTFVPPDPSGPIAYGHEDGGPVYPANAEPAAGGLWTTAGDLARFFAEIRRSYHGNGLLPRDLARQMLTPQSGRPYGWSVIIDDAGADVEFGHGGQAPGCQAMGGLRVHSGLGAVLLTNADTGRELVTRVIAAVWPSQQRLANFFSRAVDETHTSREQRA